MSQSLFTHTEHKMSMPVDQHRFPQPITVSSTAKQQHSTPYTQNRTITPINLLYNHSSLINQPSVTQLQLPPTTSLLQPHSIATSQSISTFSQLPKHWIWNSNLFYPGSRNIREGFTPYTSNFSGIFSQSKTVFCEKFKKNMDLAGNYSIKINSANEDSIDDDDNSVKMVHDIAVNEPASSTLSSNKKRNPYSIEELLKKPEKRIRTTTSNLPVTSPISNISNIYLECIDTKSHTDNAIIYEDNNNPITFYE